MRHAIECSPLKATALRAFVEEFRFCGTASRVDEWIIILAYHVISDQRENALNFMPAAWVRALLSTGKLYDWFVRSADS